MVNWHRTITYDQAALLLKIATLASFGIIAAVILCVGWLVLAGLLLGVFFYYLVRSL